MSLPESSCKKGFIRNAVKSFCGINSFGVASAFASSAIVLDSIFQNLSVVSTGTDGPKNVCGFKTARPASSINCFGVLPI